MGQLTEAQVFEERRRRLDRVRQDAQRAAVELGGDDDVVSTAGAMVSRLDQERTELLAADAAAARRAGSVVCTECGGIGTLRERTDGSTICVRGCPGRPMKPTPHVIGLVWRLGPAFAAVPA